MLTVETTVGTLAVMDIPRWLRGVYQEGKDSQRWTSVEEMAHQHGFKASTLYRWMTGSRHPDPVSCMRLGQALGAPVKDVLQWAGHDAEMFALLT